MPYVPSEKATIKDIEDDLKDKNITKIEDRKLIDKEVKKLSKKIAKNIETNKDIRREYFGAFWNIGNIIEEHYDDSHFNYIYVKMYKPLAKTIIDIGELYNYEGAFLGELNYAMTRLIQEVPKRLFEMKKLKKEFRYFLYAYTVSALVGAVGIFEGSYIGIDGVFEDVKDEYKRRANIAYEAKQINLFGDCYNTPYHTKLIEVKDQHNNVIGHQEVMIKHENDNGKDILGEIVIRVHE